MKKLVLIMVIAIVAEAGLYAQPNPGYGQGQGPGPDPIGKAFFPPEMVMQNQQAINLTEAQRNNISKEMQNAQAEFMNMQWQLESESEKFKSLIQKENPAETQVLAQLDQMLTIENKIKKRQITLLIKIKNILSHDQQEILEKLKGSDNRK